MPRGTKARSHTPNEGSTPGPNDRDKTRKKNARNSQRSGRNDRKTTLTEAIKRKAVANSRKKANREGPRTSEHTAVSENVKELNSPRILKCKRAASPTTDCHVDASKNETSFKRVDSDATKSRPVKRTQVEASYEEDIEMKNGRRSEGTDSSDCGLKTEAKMGRHVKSGSNVTQENGGTIHNMINDKQNMGKCRPNHDQTEVFQRSSRRKKLRSEVNGDELWEGFPSIRMPRMRKKHYPALLDNKEEYARTRSDDAVAMIAQMSTCSTDQGGPNIFKRETNVGRHLASQTQCHKKEFKFAFGRPNTNKSKVYTEWISQSYGTSPKSPIIINADTSDDVKVVHQFMKCATNVLCKENVEFKKESSSIAEIIADSFNIPKTSCKNSQTHKHDKQAFALSSPAISNNSRKEYTLDYEISPGGSRKSGEIVKLNSVSSDIVILPKTVSEDRSTIVDIASSIFSGTSQSDSLNSLEPQSAVTDAEPFSGPVPGTSSFTGDRDIRIPSLRHTGDKMWDLSILKTILEADSCAESDICSRLQTSSYFTHSSSSSSSSSDVSYSLPAATKSAGLLFTGQTAASCLPKGTQSSYAMNTSNPSSSVQTGCSATDIPSASMNRVDSAPKDVVHQSDEFLDGRYGDDVKRSPRLLQKNKQRRDLPIKSEGLVNTHLRTKEQVDSNSSAIDVGEILGASEDCFSSSRTDEVPEIKKAEGILPSRRRSQSRRSPSGGKKSPAADAIIITRAKLKIPEKYGLNTGSVPAFVALPEASPRKRKFNSIELLQDLRLTKHACALWSSEQRRRFQQEHPGATSEKLDNVMRVHWEKLTDKERVRYYQRARNALNDRYKAPGEGLKKKAERAPFKSRSSSTISPQQFRILSISQQYDVIKRKLVALQNSLSSSEYQQFLSDFAGSLKQKRNELKRKLGTTNAESLRAELDDSARQLLYEKLLSEGKKVASLEKKREAGTKRRFKAKYKAILSHIIEGRRTGVKFNSESKELGTLLEDLGVVSGSTADDKVCSEEERPAGKSPPSDHDKECVSEIETYLKAGAPPFLLTCDGTSGIPEEENEFFSQCDSCDLLLDACSSSLEPLEPDDVNDILTQISGGEVQAQSGDDTGQKTLSQLLLECAKKLNEFQTTLDADNGNPCCSIGDPSCILSSLLVSDKYRRLETEACYRQAPPSFPQ